MHLHNLLNTFRSFLDKNSKPKKGSYPYAKHTFGHLDFLLLNNIFINIFF